MGLARNLGRENSQIRLSLGVGVWGRVWQGDGGSEGVGRNRWGDYSMAVYDWTCGNAWGAAEYATDSNSWGTRIFARTLDDEPPCPYVHMISPNGGESLSGSTGVLSWTAGDADGDPLEYVIQYSTDAGATWQTLVTSWQSTTYELDLGSIPGSDQALIRVLASDGFHTAQDQSDATFSVAKNAPLGVAASKQLIRASQGSTEAEMWAAQGELYGKVFTSNDAAEGPAAFAEKRQPTYTGR